uniref:Leukocyte immunoglobulin-like receptor subfamily B member 3 n=1 Tax=Phascolarctos cinereus TaxID=38626 RepID=A0A6P5LSE0_PHACI|nr:leukocyte immunoglobulin-like receptor subfamily B member 3 [Phascolarctos cinereus]
MASALSALLSLGLCLGLEMGDEASLPDTFTRPSLWAEPGTLIPVGTNVTLWCRGPAGTRQYHVPRVGLESPSWPQTEAEFPIPSVAREDAGQYCCLYRGRSGWSRCSHPLELVVTGIYEKPTLLALPSHSVATGKAVILQCEAESRSDRFALYKEGDAHTHTGYEWRSQASFPIPAVTRAHEGTYRCYSFSSNFPYHWSGPSDPLKLIVTAPDLTPVLLPRNLSKAWNSGQPIESSLRSPEALGRHPDRRLTTLHLALPLLPPPLPPPASGQAQYRGQSGRRQGDPEELQPSWGRAGTDPVHSSEEQQTEQTRGPGCPRPPGSDLRPTDAPKPDLRLEQKETLAGCFTVHKRKSGGRRRAGESAGTRHREEPGRVSDRKLMAGLVPSPVWATSLQSSPGTTMSPWLPALLYLGLCLSGRIKAQDHLLPKPSLWAKPDHLMPEGQLVTVWCQGPSGAVGYKLEKVGTFWFMLSYPNGNKASFFLGKMRVEAAGLYRCHYWTSSGWTESSDPLMLIVTGQYDKPILSVMPSSVVAPGQTVTFHCQSLYGLDGFMMSKDQADNMTPHYEWKTLASFSIQAVTAAHGGTYRCHTFHSDFPYVWSAPSNPLVLRVTDTPEEHSLPVPREPDPTSRTSSPKLSNLLFGLPRLIASILMGILALIILLFLFLLFFLLRRCSQHQARLKTRGKKAEIKESLRSSDSAGTPVEETLYAAVNDDRQTEEARQEDTAVPKREDPQEVTYAQLNPNSLKAGAKDPPPSGPVEPSLYASLRVSPGQIVLMQTKETLPIVH